MSSICKQEKVVAKVMIMSLGGSPAPLSKSIKEHKPERVIFLASHDTVTKSGEDLIRMTPRPATEYEITEDPNLLYECYKAARRCVDRIRRMQVTSSDVLVDYTGGTKVMTSALILATVGHPYQFNYVGGGERSKNGLGTVMDGHEKMYPEMSPWSVFAEEERRQIVTLFNNRRFASVVMIIDGFGGDPPLQIKMYFAAVRALAEGFLYWDQFTHKAASRRMKEAIDLLAVYLKNFPDPALEDFVRKIGECQGRLQEILDKTADLKNPDFVLVEDLLNNARRRMWDRRFDDAAARIYRSLELYGQVAFEKVAGCPNDKVKPDAIPEALREEFVKKYLDDGKYLKLPLTATFRYLQEVGHDAGKRYFDRFTDLKKVTVNRNYSILAHGIQPVSEKAVNSMFDLIADFVGFKDRFDFPELP
jgi:CRISPR-associated protein (TIGR02710 family)